MGKLTHKGKLVREQDKEEMIRVYVDNHIEFDKDTESFRAFRKFIEGLYNYDPDTHAMRILGTKNTALRFANRYRNELLRAMLLEQGYDLVGGCNVAGLFPYVGKHIEVKPCDWFYKDKPKAVGILKHNDGFFTIKTKEHKHPLLIAECVFGSSGGYDLMIKVLEGK